MGCMPPDGAHFAGQNPGHDPGEPPRGPRKVRPNGKRPRRRAKKGKKSPPPAQTAERPQPRRKRRKDTPRDPAGDATQLANQALESLARAWETAAPHLSRAIGWVGRMIATMFHFGLSHRLGLFRLSHRVMWWGALALMLLAGRALLGGFEEVTLLPETYMHFALGLGLCCVVLVFAVERRLRVAAFLLGGGHGALATLAWLVSQ